MKNKGNKKKKKFNLYSWTNKNKQKIAGTICVVLVLAMLVSLLS